MRLSVIIPYYNADAWIGAMLDSLLDQDLPKTDYEILVVDDGSAEDPVVLKRYAAQYPIIHYYRQENGGVSAARNTAIPLAKGDWLYFCDSDDFVQPQVLGRMIALAESERLDMLFARCIEVYPGDVVPTPRRNFDKHSPVWTGYGYIANHPVMPGYGAYRYLIRREFVAKHQLLFDLIYFAEDRIFLLKALFKAQRVMEVDVDLYYYVQRESSIMHAPMRKHYGTRYSEPIRRYLIWLSGLISDPAVPEDTRHSLVIWRDSNTYRVLLNSFRYASVAVLRENLALFKQLGCYPLILRRGKWKERVYRCWMNCRPLWVLGCQVYQLFPQSFRDSH